LTIVSNRDVFLLFIVEYVFLKRQIASSQNLSSRKKHGGGCRDCSTWERKYPRCFPP
jgi:hypothetical protein